MEETKVKLGPAADEKMEEATPLAGAGKKRAREDDDGEYANEVVKKVKEEGQDKKQVKFADQPVSEIIGESKTNDHAEVPVKIGVKAKTTVKAEANGESNESHNQDEST